jgi:hypothetical protein
MRLRISPTTGLSFDLMRQPSAAQSAAPNIRQRSELVNKMGIQFCTRDASAILCQTWKTKQAERSCYRRSGRQRAACPRHNAKLTRAHASTAIRQSTEFALRLSSCRFHNDIAGQIADSKKPMKTSCFHGLVWLQGKI